MPTRWWLGGVGSPHRDRARSAALVWQVPACAAAVERAGLRWLVGVDGLASSVTACRRALRVPVRRGLAHRPHLVLPAGFLLGQVVKQYAQAPGHRVVSVAHRAVGGPPAAIAAALVATSGGTVSNTAYIERLKATFRAHLVPLPTWCPSCVVVARWPTRPPC